MRKTTLKLISTVLAVCMVFSGLVFTAPASAAATYPTGLANGTQSVNYTQSQVLDGKYLVQIDVVKHSPNYNIAPQNIISDAGDIIVAYRPDNGNAPQQTKKLEDVIPANVFNTYGKGQFTYYAVLEGFPETVTASVRKNNPEENDTGLYVGIKIWNCNQGAFITVYDFADVAPTNGSQTNDLIFTSIAVQNSFYPYAIADSGSATIKNLTLPAGLTPTTATQSFFVYDQWGVNMMSPNFTYTSVTGLSFSQEKNVLTVYGTGDANNPSANTRTVSVTASYDSSNKEHTNAVSLTKSFTVTNSAVVTYAPTYANREKAGLGLAFMAGTNTDIDKFELDSSYRMTTSNYVVVKNNSSRKATVTLSTDQSQKFSIQSPTFTLEAGESTSVRLLDSKVADKNYTADITATYTLEGLYSASGGSLLNLSTGSSMPFIYNKVTQPSVRVYDTNNYGRKIDVIVKYVTNHGYLDFISKNEDQDKSSFSANFYIDTSRYSTYNAAGLGFRLYQNNENEQFFQYDGDYCGSYIQKGSYDAAGTFGFSPNPSTHTSSYVEEIDRTITSDAAGEFVAFYGTIFSGSSSSASPAEIYFSAGKKGEGLEFYAPGTALPPVPANSAYLVSSLYVYAYNKAPLRNLVRSFKNTNLLSCYYGASDWTTFCSASASMLRNAQITLGTDITSQYAVTQAYNNLNSSLSQLKSKATNGSYAVVHYKHEGDMKSAIVGTAVDFFVIELGNTNMLKFNNDYSTQCNKHTLAYSATMSQAGSYEYIYHYWNIDFSGVNSILNEYNSVKKVKIVNKDYDQFSNNDVVRYTLAAVQSIDQSQSAAEPQTQNEVDNKVNALRTDMRKLQYISYEMTVTHVMLDVETMEEIENDEVQTTTNSYNETATYGEVIDGLKNIDDGTYTILGKHFTPVENVNFLENSSFHYFEGVMDNYVVDGSKEITFYYYAKSIDDTELDNLVTDTLQNATSWRSVYTKSSINDFLNWFNPQYKNGTLTKSFNIFEKDEYQQLLSTYRAKLEGLDPIIQGTQVLQLNSFVLYYSMLSNMSDLFCNSDALLSQHAPTYYRALALLDMEADGDAGSKAAQEVIEAGSQLELHIHELPVRRMLAQPLDGMDGSFYITCSYCKNIIDSGAFLAPFFNTFIQNGYDYSQRAASLRIEGEETGSDTQGLRFAASSEVPKGAKVTDFGFVYAKTKDLNGGVEPANNNPVNISALTTDNEDVTGLSLMNQNYSTYKTQEGNKIYTFNLVLNLGRDDWNDRVAARSYITYKYHGLETTVYDSTYSSRSVMYIARCVFNNPEESEQTREFVAQKFGLS